MNNKRIEDILNYGEKKPISYEDALFLFKQSINPEVALKLFKTASYVRDNEVGKYFKLDGEIAPVMPCLIDPFCNYCTFSRQVLSKSDFIEGLKFASDLGLENMRLSGGSDLNDFGDGAVHFVEIAKQHIDAKLHLNIGPTYSHENLVKLKALGIGEVGSSLETINEDAFFESKPGDSLEQRKQTAIEIGKHGIDLQSIIMAGLSYNDEDYIKHIFWLKSIPTIKHVPISRFDPKKDTPMENKKRTSPWLAARLCAITRLVLRTVDIRIAAGGGPDDIPLWILAGGNRITSIFIHKTSCEPERFEKENMQVISREIHNNLEVVNRSEIATIFASEMGFEVIGLKK
ncbi:MAG: radical SAM protein [Arcobacteraceae bacterium]